MVVFCFFWNTSQLIQAVNSITANAELYGIVADIKSTASSFEFSLFRWISRVRNNEADELAKRALADEIVLMTIA